MTFSSNTKPLVTEEFLFTTFRCISDAVIATDRDGCVTFLNHPAETATGWQLPEAAGKPLGEVFDIRSEETGDRAENPVDSVFREGAVVGLADHTKLICRDGSELSIAYSEVPVGDIAGETVGAVLVFRYVTERRKLEDAVQHAREYAESIVSTVREPLIVLDADMRVVTASRAFYMAYQVTQEETEGQVLYDLGNRQWDIPALRELLEQILPADTILDDFELEHEFETIGQRTMLLNARRIHREADDAQMVLLAIEDVTERRKLEDAVQHAREYAESIVSTVREPLIVLDADMRVVTASRAFYMAYQVTQEETEGQVLYDLGNRQWDIPALRELLEQILPADTILDDFELEHEFETIGQRTMLLNARRIHREADDAQMVLLAIEDVTERKRGEEELRLSEIGLRDANNGLAAANLKLTSANKEMEAFAYSVSHDLRAPLRGIDGFSKALLDEYQDKLDDTGRGYLNRVRAGTQRIGWLIDDLLKLSRLSQIGMSHQNVEVGELAGKIAHEMQEDEPERQVDFVCAPGITAFGDRALLNAALENLLRNAWKFTIGREHARIEFGASEQNGERVYYVRDDGVGFDMTYVDKLFGAFQRLHTAAEFPGSGIGLAIVQRVIQRHGGRVWAEGEVGKGATFSFTLPTLASASEDDRPEVGV